MKSLPIILITLCLSLPGQSWGQHYVGKHKTEVLRLMKENINELYEDNTSKNPVYNMVKYIDNLGSQTLIYFFSDQDTCLYSKWMCDYFMLNKVVSGLNEKYRQSADDTWHYTQDDREYRVSLTTGEWYFTISTRPKITD